MLTSPFLVARLCSVLLFFTFASKINTVSTIYVLRANMRFLASLKKAYLLPRPQGEAFSHVCPTLEFLYESAGPNVGQLQLSLEKKMTNAQGEFELTEPLLL